MNKKSRFFKKIICGLILFIQVTAILFAAEPTVKLEPYTKDNMPTWAKDLRRTEIITFGSLPFVTLGVTIGYSFYRYFSNGMNPDYFPNPMAKTSEGANLSTDEQIGIIMSSIGISTLIGLTDLTINLVKRNQEKKRAAELDKGSVIIETLPTETVPAEVESEE